MKKMLGILIALAFVGSICFAQETAKTLPAPIKASSAAVETKTIIGKVVSVTVADPAKGITNGTVSIVDATGQTANYTVSSATKVLDNAFNAITLNQLKTGEKIKVKGKKTATGEEAQSIAVLK